MPGNRKVAPWIRPARDVGRRHNRPIQQTWHLETILELFGGHLEAMLELFGGRLGANLGQHGVILGNFKEFLSHLGLILGYHGAFWAHLGPT